MSENRTFLHELAEELNSMEHHIDAMEAEVRGRSPELAEELREKLRAARDHADALKDSGENELHEHAARARTAWEDLKDVLSKARSRLGD